MRDKNFTTLISAIVTLVLIAVLSTPAVARDKYGQTIEKRYEKAVTRARKMRLPRSKSTYDPQSSASILEKVVKARPNYFRAWYNLGLAYHQMGDYPKARSSFDRAIAIRDKEKLKDSSIINTAGWSAMKNSDFTRARKLLHQAERETKGQRNSTVSAILGNLGELYYLLQDFDRAKKYLTRAKSEFNNRNADYFLQRIDRVSKKLSY